MNFFNKNTFIIVSLLLLTACGKQKSNDGFDFDDLAQLESTEQTELLSLAEQAARSHNFSQAKNYLGQAKQKGYAQLEIANTQKILTASIKSYEAKQARIRKAEQERKAREEQQRLAQQRSQQNSSGSGNGGAKSIVVRAECIGLFCTVKTFKVTGGPGGVSDGYNTGYINDYGQGVAGTYHYSATLNNNRHCSGSFRLTGKYKYIIVNMYDNNCKSYLTKSQ